MARTKETKMSPEQQEKMTQEVMASLQPSTYGKDYAQEHSSFFEEVENSDLEVVPEDVAATTSNMEDELTNEVQSPPNPQKRISGKQRKATLEEYQQTFLQVPRIDDRKPVFVSSDVRDRLDRVVRPYKCSWSCYCIRCSSAARRRLVQKISMACSSSSTGGRDGAMRMLESCGSRP